MSFASPFRAPMASPFRSPFGALASGGGLDVDFSLGQWDSRLLYTGNSAAWQVYSDGVLDWKPENLIPTSVGPNSPYGAVNWVAAIVPAPSTEVPPVFSAAVVSKSVFAGGDNNSGGWSLTGLVVGFTYTATAYVWHGVSNNVSASAALQATSATVTGRVDGDPARRGTWQRVSLTFMATATTSIVYMRCGVSAGDALYTTAWRFQRGSHSLDEDDALLLTSGSAVYGPRHRDYAYSATKPACTLEPPSTNSIRNNTMVGAVAGTPGTLPTNWGGSLATVNGIAINVVGSGYEAGIPYVDLRIFGTSTQGSTLYRDIQLDATPITAAAGQTWTLSTYARIVAGSTAGLFQPVALIGYGTPGLSNNISAAMTALNSGPLSNQRYFGTLTYSDGAMTGISPRIGFYVTALAAVDLTIRIGAPQLEQFSRATSPMLTFGSAFTRFADQLQVTGAAFSALWSQSGATLVIEGFAPPVSGVNQYFASVSDLSLSNRSLTLFQHWGTSDANARHTVGGVQYTPAAASPTLTPGALVKLAMSAQPGLAHWARNGVYQGASAPPSMPTGLVALSIGCNEGGAGQQLGGGITRIRLIPGFMSQPELLAA